MTQLVPYVFQNLGSAPVSQLDANLGYVSGKWVSVKDAAFGAKGDGITDDTAAINAAISYTQSLGAGSRLWFPLGTYLIKSVLSISVIPIRFVGEGMGVSAYGPTLATQGATIKYAGTSTNSAVVSFNSVQSSCGIEHMTIDANSLADTCLRVDTCTYGNYFDIELTNANKHCLILSANNNNACAWNEFRQVAMDLSASGAVSALYLTGIATANSCHNRFYGLRINHGGTASNGIDLGNCDNNLFVHSYVQRVAGSGVGVNVIPTELAGFPGANVFILLEATGGGWFQPAGTTQPQIVIGYNQSVAAVTNSTPLFLVDQNGNFNTLSCGDIGAALSATTVFRVFKTGIAQIIAGFNGTSSNFYDADAHNFRNSAGTSGFTINGNVVSVASGGSYRVNSIQVISSRQTGYTAFTGTTNTSTSYDPSTITLVQLAQRVAALQASLTVHGLIGT